MTLAPNQFLGQTGQSLEDVCMNTYGTLDLFIKLCLDNSIPTTLSDSLVAGFVFTYDTTLVKNANIGNYLQGNAVIYCTLNTPSPLGVSTSGASFEYDSYDDSFEN